MKTSATLDSVSMRRAALAACTLALAGAFVASRVPPARAAESAARSVPAAIQVPAGNRPYFEGHAVGTQNYVCLPSGSGFAWTLVTPEATLFDQRGEQQLTTHFASPNPAEGGAVRATWQHSRDSSSVWALAMPPSTDPAFVAPGAIPWLLLRVVGTKAGPAGGDTLSKARYIQRVNTAGGVAPAIGCSQQSDIGSKAFVPYSADYVFYAGR